MVEQLAVLRQALVVAAKGNKPKRRIVWVSPEASAESILHFRRAVVQPEENAEDVVSAYNPVRWNYPIVLVTYETLIAVLRSDKPEDLRNMQQISGSVLVFWKTSPPVEFAELVANWGCEIITA